MAPEALRRRDLRRGTIFEIAVAAGLTIPSSGNKRAIRCPLHDDRTASAFLSFNNVFYCSVCTPAGGWTAKRFAEALHVLWPPPDAFPFAPEPPRFNRNETHEPTFQPAVAREVWRHALERAREDPHVDEDRPVYDYLAGRGLLESWEHSLFGILSEGMEIAESIAWWPRSGYRLIAPLYDLQGDLVNVQARAIIPAEKKILFPSGSIARGTAFASRSGLRLLRGEDNGPRRVILAEGLTDYLAVATVSTVPVLSAPGTGSAASSIGGWAKGARLFIATDRDEAGDKAVNPTAKNAFRAGAARVIRTVWPEQSKDACDVVAKVGLEGLAAFLHRLILGDPYG